MSSLEKFAAADGRLPYQGLSLNELKAQLRMLEHPTNPDVSDGDEDIDPRAAEKLRAAIAAKEKEETIH